MAAKYRGLMEDRQELTACISESLADYREPVPGAKQRVEQVLQIMLTAWVSSMLQKEAESLLAQLPMKGE